TAANSLDELKPGTLTRMLSLRKRIKERWKLADEGVESERKMDSPKKPQPKVVTRGRQAEDEDQTPRDERVMTTQTDLSAEDYLEQEGKTWQEVEIHFGSKKDTALGDMEPNDLAWWVNNWKPKKFKGKFG